MNRMIHTQSEPQTSFGGPLIEQKMPSQHMQQQQQTQSAQQHQNQNGAAQLMLNRIISSAYSHSHDNGFDGSILLNGGPQKFDFLPNLPAHPGHLMQNGGILGNQQPRGTGTNGTTAKKKKGAGPGRRPALDSNGLPKERPFMCPKQDCQKRFCRNDHLQRHLRIHTGQRMFQCRTCLRSFSRSDHLAKHERTHSADKPYSCHTCARRFHKHEEKKKHEEKCQHKVDDSNAPNQQQRQLNLMSGGQAPSHLMYQNPASSSSSFGHHFNRLVDDIERFHAIAEHELDDAPI